MKIPRLLCIAAACFLVVSCEKPPSEAEKNAQVEKEVQARLAAERLADDQQRLAQQQADLEAREKALAGKESATVAPTPRSTPRPVASTASSSSYSSSAGNEADSSYDTFYRKLEPYGAWRESEDYGFVWQPREAQSRNWRPYTDGRWTYTDAGWTWVSDEPFGWATYHYGRWTRLSGVGWVWVPGDEWAPAWVSWRKGDQNVGWAPLPPQARFDRNKGIHKWADNYYDIDAGEYVFVPNEEIGAENIRRAVLPAERNVAIVSETTNVTNITYSNTTIVNEGPSYDEMRGHSRRPVERLRLQREFDVQQTTEPKSRISGQVLQILTPHFNTRATAAPRTSAPRIERATVERETTGGDPAQFERARQKMRSESTPPPDAPTKKFDKPAIAPSGAATPAATAAMTPAPAATAAATAIPTATPQASARPAFTPRATPVATVIPTATPVVAPSASATASATQTPRVRATPAVAPSIAAPVTTPSAVPAATPVPEREATAPTPAPTEGLEHNQVKPDMQRQRPGGAPKIREPNRAPDPKFPAATAAPVAPPEDAAAAAATPGAKPPARPRGPVGRPSLPIPVQPTPSDSSATAPAAEPNAPAQNAPKAPHPDRRGQPRKPAPAATPGAPAEEKPAATPEP